MTLSQFEHYAAIATVLVIPFLGALADFLLGRALAYVEHADKTPDPLDDVRAARLLRYARRFVAVMDWIGANVGRAIPLVRRFVVDRAPNPTPSLERAEGAEPEDVQ